MADYYELLGVVARRHRRRDQAGLPPAGPRAAPRRQPRRPRRPRRGSRRWRSPTRCSRDPRAPPALRPYGDAGRRQAGNPFGGGRPRRHLRHVLHGGSPFGGGAPGRPARPAAPTSRRSSTSSFEEAVFGAEAAGDACAPRCRATTARPPAPRRAPAPTTCPECGGAGQVRRVRQSILGQMVTAGPCPRCSGFGTIVERRARPAAARAAASRSATYTVDVPAGVDTGATLRLSGRGAVGPRGGGPATSTSTSGCAPTTLRAPRRRPRPRAARPGHPGGARRPRRRSRRSTAPRTRHRAAAPRPGEVSGCGRGVPHVRAAAEATCSSQVVVDTPTELTAEEEELLAPARRAAGRRGRAARRRV